MKANRWAAVLLSLVALALAGCRGGGASPPAPTRPPATVGAILTVAAQLSATPMPSPTPTLTPSPRPTATPTPTPTLPPATALVVAQRAAEDGDYARAIALWEGAFAQGAAASKAALAISLTHAYLDDARPAEAIAWASRALSATATTEQTTEASGLLAVAYETQGNWRAAVAAYERFLEREPSLAPEVRRRLAKAHTTLNEPERALQHLAALPLAESAPAQRAEILEEMAALRRKQGDYDGALKAYDDILAFAQRADYRATILQRQAEVLTEAKRAEAAQALYARILSEHAASPAAYAALKALDAAGATKLTPLERGKLLYNVGQYQEALAALQQHLLAEKGGPEDAEAHYYAGQARRRLEQYAPAFQQFDLVIEQYAVSPLVPEAWLAKAQAAAAYGSDPSGLYYEFALRYPNHTRAAEALWLGAVALERQREWAQAGRFYGALRTRYPGDTRAAEALFREGLAAYAQRDFATARQLWGSVAMDALPGEERARRLTWLGLAARAAGESDAAQGMWREAVAAASGSYYALRAGDLAAGVSLRLPLTLTTTLREGTFGAAEREEAGAWVQGWAAESARTLETVAAEPLARRAAALARLGWRADAAAAYRALRDQLNNDAAGLLALAQLTREQRVYSVSIASAERLLALGAKAGASEAPRALRRLAYPTYYSHLVVAEAATRQVDPLLFMALIRQESRFDPVAVSYAGASGLTQVMPDTGTWIATKTGFQGFRPALLARAVVNVPFGVYYLAYQLDRDERDWMGALIAYNAGPGTLSRLTNDKPITDNDLLYETIPYAQTRDYVRLITQQYRIYEELYRPR